MVDIVMLLYMVLLKEFLQKKVAFAMVWKDGKAEIAFKNKDVLQVGQTKNKLGWTVMQYTMPAKSP